MYCSLTMVTMHFRQARHPQHEGFTLQGFRH